MNENFRSPKFVKRNESNGPYLSNFASFDEAVLRLTVLSS